MNRINKKKILIIIGALCVVISIFVVIALIGKEENKTTKIGFIMSGSKDESGWNGMHYEGIKSACDKQGVELLIKENVKEFTGECNKAIDELADEGAEMIVLSSYNYSVEVTDQVKEYKDIVFYVNSSEFSDINMTSYFVRMYQARYLAGITAGMKTESNTIGYVAAMENSEVNRGINAFTLGVKSVNPDAEVVVMWTGEWDNAQKEKTAARTLIEQEKADVLTYHQNQPNVVMVAEEEGIYSIGYHEAMEDCSDKYIGTVMCNWQIVYEELLREFLVGKGNIKDNYWIGLEVDAVKLSLYSNDFSNEIVQKIEEAKEEILSGDEIFSGIIYDNRGELRCGEKEAISDEILLEHMDWFVEGVRIYEK